MLNRVTNLTLTSVAVRNLQAQQSTLGTLQDKASTLDKIKRPSDDPAATGQALQTRARQAAAAQYGQNINDGNSWLSMADSALGQASTLLNRVRDLTVQASNGSLNQSGKEAIASELEGLNQDLLSVANTQFLGRNIFAGSSDASGAFTAGTPRDPNIPGDTGTPPSFNGNPTSSVQRRVSETQTIRVDADGSKIFGSGAGSVFDVISKIAADLRTNQDVTPRLATLDAGLKNVIDGRADIGTRQARLQRAGTVNTDLEASLDTQRTGIEKADLAGVIMDLNLQQTNYQVALAATAKVLQPSLMDFLK